ncbi:hypothetical protein E2562_006406 [Oryza meyeriana var. granulata]|uniref:Uncharacterized protein n=1 Tax=Oryza meyeriana var. granulata TaxID=110450 RepID=A0A6G1EGJ5_9ORYZ|nr:hypothetical protein E2562_006406 [Oryza meyeriana var. granulata]
MASEGKQEDSRPNFAFCMDAAGNLGARDSMEIRRWHNVLEIDCSATPSYRPRGLRRCVAGPHSQIADDAVAGPAAAPELLPVRCSLVDVAVGLT